MPATARICTEEALHLDGLKVGQSESAQTARHAEEVARTAMRSVDATQETTMPSLLSAWRKTVPPLDSDRSKLT